ncbi:MULTISPECIES: hypothetical protein [unclassified Streptomyces]|uniref:hypothetical protein n=1 Tax=unclassified Streptomyces TaxID=2593676 RepID=UPI001F033890|nr:MULTISPECIES: hypothetical protein [unclassified Streptomyces]
MPLLTAPDGTELAHHVRGDGAPLVVQPGAGHCPWLDDAEGFVRRVLAFLGEGSGGGQGRRAPGSGHGASTSCGLSAVGRDR